MISLAVSLKYQTYANDAAKVFATLLLFYMCTWLYKNVFNYENMALHFL